MKALYILKCGTKITSLQGYAGDYEDWMMSAMRLSSAQCRVVDAHAPEQLPGADKVGAVVITGSGAMVTDQEPWMLACQAWLKDLHERNVPVLGICFGHQLLAAALGGSVADNPNGVEVGTVELTLHAAAQHDALLGGLDDMFVHVSHRQCVIIIPPEATVLASTRMDPLIAVHFGGRTWGLQFHPEFNEQVTPHYIDYYKPELLAVARDREVLRKQVRPTPQAAGLLKRFAMLAGYHA